MQQVLRDGHGAVGVPQYQIGIGTHGNRAFLRIEAVNLGVVGRGQRDELLQRDAAFRHAFREQDRQPCFDTGNPVGHIAEGLLALGVQLALGAVIDKGAVIGREGLEHAGAQSFPDGFPAVAVARGRGADIFAAGLVEILALHILFGQRDILRAGFTIDFESALLRPADLFHRLTARHMHDHDRHVDQFCVADGAVGGFALDKFGTRFAMIIGRGLACRFQPFGHEFDGIIALAMNHHQGLLAPCHIEHIKQLAVIENHFVIGHEHLERGVAIGHQCGQFLPQNRRGRIGDDQMDAVIGNAVSFRQFLVFRHALAQGGAARLGGKGNDGGIAARHRRHRAGGEVIGHTDARAVLAQMHMAIDAARHDQKSRGVDLGFGSGNAVGQCGDAAVPDADVALHHIGCGHHRSASDRYIKITHTSLSFEQYSAGFSDNCRSMQDVSAVFCRIYAVFMPVFLAGHARSAPMPVRRSRHSGSYRDRWH